MARFTLQQFTDFLKSIDLETFRHQYSGVKILEQDLDKNIQALRTIYEQYWDNKDERAEPLGFEDYYALYLSEHAKEIDDFWHNKSGFGTDCDCFHKGLKARIYRTWASLITQIHGGYVAETVYGPDSVEMSESLDRANVDFRITSKDKQIDVQIKKQTNRREIARMKDGSEREDGIKYIRYNVPSQQDYENPYYKIKSKSGQLRESVKDFIKFNPHGTLDRLDNGFVIFTQNAFKF